jgi:rsbT antagonist protein RsbS
MSASDTRVPIIRLWNVLLVPFQGEITDVIAARLESDVLAEIKRTGVSGLVLDITAVWMVDSHLCAVLSNLGAAAKLLGAETVISGMSPEVAMTLQTMGAELTNLRTALKLEPALEMLGIRLAATPHAPRRGQ